MENNILYIRNGKIKLQGFAKLSNEVSFCFRQEGVTISNNIKDRPYSFETQIKDGQIHSDALVQMLSDRGIVESHFICINNCYFELEPHPEKIMISESFCEEEHQPTLRWIVK